MSGTDIERLRLQSRWLGRLTLFLLTATALLIAWAFLVDLVALARRPGDQWPALMGRSLLRWSPSFFYLYSLWAIRSAFSSFAQGGVFGPAVARGCTRAGIALAAGGTMSAVGVPNIVRLLPAPQLPAGQLQHIGAVLHFDTAYLAVGVVGLALILLGRLLGRAAELQSETARLQGELDSFF